MRLVAAASVLVIAGLATFGLLARSVESHEALSQRLDVQSWAPPYFEGRVALFATAQQDPLLAAMRAEGGEPLRVGDYTYRTSPARVTLGRRLFESYDWGTSGYWRPTTRFIFYALGAESAEDLRARYGLLVDRSGALIGLTGLVAADGRLDYGWSCALCHSGLDSEGNAVPGSPNHQLDYGRIYHRGMVDHPSRPAVIGPMVDRDTPLADLISLGPGRIDMNQDRSPNPVKIPSLWGLRTSRSGMYANGSVDNIWMGIAHNGGPFPPSELVEAVVAYVLSLDPPPNPRAAGDAATRGRAIFARADCASCHAGPYYTNGEVIPLERIGTNPARVKMELPKGYRVPSLRRLDLQKLFLHDGSITSLADLFSRDRLRAVPGHEYGLDLSKAERQDLVAFLLAL